MHKFSTMAIKSDIGSPPRRDNLRTHLPGLWSIDFINYFISII
jgi:hypothetical protein